jgi:hypothetical protein
VDANAINTLVELGAMTFGAFFMWMIAGGKR